MRLSLYLGLIAVFWTMSMLILQAESKFSHGHASQIPPEAAEAQKRIVSSFLHAWRAYSKYSWGHDELCSLTKASNDWIHMGSTIVDSLSSLHIMNLTTEFEKAEEWVRNDLKFNETDEYTSFFEVNIRILGGLISAYELSNRMVFLNKAQELGELMTRAFKDSEFPYSYYNFKTGEGRTRKELRFLTSYGPIYGQSYYSLSEIGTLSLEFSALSFHTHNDLYKNLSSTIINKLLSAFDPGILPNGIYKDNTHTNIFTAAGEADSYYEYLLKQFIHTGSTDNLLKSASIDSILDIVDKLVQQDVSGLFYLGMLKNGQFSPQMDHLSCFFPGMIILGILKLEIDNSERLLTIAKELAYTCYSMYRQSSSGLAPETIYVEFGVKYPWFSDYHYALRPETLESIWYLYYYTGDKIYREWAWNIYLAIEKFARNDAGYAEIENVNSESPNQRGCLPSYFFSETLKYLYLIFSDEKLIDLDKWVLNTEGHPLKIKYVNTDEVRFNRKYKEGDLDYKG